MLILVLLALPVLDMRLGQEDVGQLPEDTTARQSYDAISQGFGVGSNGPFLIAVEFAKPARNDRRSSLDQAEAAAARAEAQQQQAVSDQAQALVAEGVPEDEAQSEAESAVAAQGPSAAEQRKSKQQQQFLARPRAIPTWSSSRTRSPRTRA